MMYEIKHGILLTNELWRKTKRITSILKKKEKLISRIYNVMNKMTVLGNTNENRISK